MTLVMALLVLLTGFVVGSITFYYSDCLQTVNIIKKLVAYGSSRDIIMRISLTPVILLIVLLTLPYYICCCTLKSVLNIAKHSIIFLNVQFILLLLWFKGKDEKRNLKNTKIDL